MKQSSSEAKLPRHDYERARSAYRKTPASLTIKEFAEKVGIPLRSLQHKMRKDKLAGDPWERDLTGAVKQQTKQFVQRVAAGLDHNAPITDEAVAIATAAATNFAVLQLHGELFDKSIHVIRDGLSMLHEQVKTGYLVVEKRIKGEMHETAIDVDADYVAKAMRGLTASLKDVIALQRHHLGLDDEANEVSYEDDLAALADAIEAEHPAALADDHPGDGG